MRNEPVAPEPASEPADARVPLSYEGRSNAPQRRSIHDLFAGAVAVLVLAVSAAGLVMTQLAALGGSLRGYPALYVTTTLLSMLMTWWSYRVTRYYFRDRRNCFTGAIRRSSGRPENDPSPKA